MILIGRGLDLKTSRDCRVKVSGHSLCSFQGVNKKADKSAKDNDKISGDYSLRDPPVPIPNTEVKPQHADGTWLETARESRTSPDSRKETGKDGSSFP